MYLDFDLFKSRSITFVDSSGSKKKMSYHEFFIKASALADAIEKRGFLPRTTVITQARESYDQLLLFWGVILADLVPAPLAFADSPQRREKLKKIQEVLPHCIILQEEVLKNVKNSQVYPSLGSMDQNLPIDIFGYQKRLLRNHALNDISKPFFWQFSSGSTSHPKGIAMSWSMIKTNIGDFLRVLNCHQHKDRFLSWMPVSHDYGMIMGHLAPLINGSDQILMSSKFFLRHPEAWLKLADDEKCSILSTTNFANHYVYKRCKNLGKAADLSGIRAIINGAEPIIHSVTQHFKKLLSSWGLSSQALAGAYGLAEGTLVVTMKKLADECNFIEIDSRTIGIGKKVRLLSCLVNSEEPKSSSYGVTIANVGKPIPSVELQVVKEANQPLKELEVGHVFIKGPTVTASILNNQGLESTGECCWTGDVGFMFKGDLYLLGRAKDHFKLNGISYFCNEIESFLVDKLGLILGQCVIAKNDFSPDEEVICFIKEASLDSYRRIASLVFSNCWKQFGLKIPQFFQVSKVPRTTSGKIQRFKLVVDCFGKGVEQKTNFKNHLIFYKDEKAFVKETSYTNSDVVDQVLAAHLGQSAILNEGAYVQDLELTSLDLLKLVNDLSNQLSISLSVVDIYANPKIADLRAFVIDKCQTPVEGRDI